MNLVRQKPPTLVWWKRLKHISVLFIVSLAGPQWKMLVSNYLHKIHGFTSNICQPLAACFWKAADQQAPPDQSSVNTHFGWIIQNDIPIPAVALGTPAPPWLVDLIKCHSKAQGKRCSSEATSSTPCTYIVIVLVEKTAVIHTLWDLEQAVKADVDYLKATLWSKM